MWKLKTGAALAVTTMLGGAAWGQVLTNGDFEESGLAGWSCTGADFCAQAPGIAYSGSNSFQGFADSSVGILSQNFATMAGATYQLSFAFQVANLANVVRYSFDGGAPIEVTEETGWTQVVTTFVASGTSSDVSLYFETDPGTATVFFDAVSVILLIPAGPTLAEELSALVAASGGAARLVVLDAQGVAREIGATSLVARDGQLGAALVGAAEGDELVRSSKSAAPGLVGNVYTWAQITGFDSKAKTGPGSILGRGFQIGADVAVGRDMVVGLSLGRSEIDATDGVTGQEGSLGYLQPYLSYRSGQWHGTASLIYGRGDYDQASAGGEGTGETRLWALTFEGSYDIALQNGFTVTPMVGLIRGQETVEGTGGTLAGASKQDYDFRQASLGARLGYRRAEGTYFAGLHADFLDQQAGGILSSEFLAEDGWTGRIEFGGSTTLNNGFGLSTSFDISGFGGTAQTVAGGLRVSLTF